MIQVIKVFIVDNVGRDRILDVPCGLARDEQRSSPRHHGHSRSNRISDYPFALAYHQHGHIVLHRSASRSAEWNYTVRANLIPVPGAAVQGIDIEGDAVHADMGQERDDMHRKVAGSLGNNVR